MARKKPTVLKVSGEERKEKAKAELKAELKRRRQTQAMMGTIPRAVYRGKTIVNKVTIKDSFIWNLRHLVQGYIYEGLTKDEALKLANETIKGQG